MHVSIKELDVALDALRQAKQNGTVLDARFAVNVAEKMFPDEPKMCVLWAETLKYCFESKSDVDTIIKIFEHARSGMISIVEETDCRIIEDDKNPIVQ